MSFWYCESCNELFSEDNIRWRCEEEVHWWLDDKPIEYLYYRECPYCRSEHIDEAVECDGCGDWFRPDELDENNMCETCRKEGWTNNAGM